MMPHNVPAKDAILIQNSSKIRTRFAPSPTGFMHLGNLRSALYPWAFARKHGGDFILRIEDTDRARSSKEAVTVILQSLEWLGLDFDDGPIYQSSRMSRYREVIDQLLQAGLAYYCYMSAEELDKLREKQRNLGLKPRYDGRWRPGNTLHTQPLAALKNTDPVIRFCNPTAGIVSWVDAVKGPISIANEQLDDLIIARAGGVPTYNFCVVVDDMDMRISHVIRGDDHINNTPRQINIFKALGYTPPVYAHLPTVLNEDGKKMSKRDGAVSVADYIDAGYLPGAILNYLARLGWAYGDNEIFSREQFIDWFDLERLGKSSAQHNSAKLNWLNQHYLKASDSTSLVPLITPHLLKLGDPCLTKYDINSGPDLVSVLDLFKERSYCLTKIAEEILFFYQTPKPDKNLLETYVTKLTLNGLTINILVAVQNLRDKLAICEWDKENISVAFKEVLIHHELKMPQLATAIRVLVCGRTSSPAIDKVLALFNRVTILKHLEQFCGK